MLATKSGAGHVDFRRPLCRSRSTANATEAAAVDIVLGPFVDVHDNQTIHEEMVVIGLSSRNGQEDRFRS
jgi:hypothetical protein